MTPAERQRRHRAKLRPNPTLAKQARRREREAALAEATVKASLALGTTRYGVIYADPPWRFEPWSRETGMDRAADNHYPTMTLKAIKGLAVPAADDCALFLWATAPMLVEALEVLQAWGFAYKTHYIWDKTRQATGYWARNEHELLLVGTRGDVPAPAPGTQSGSMIRIPSTHHSEKPAAAAEMIERYFPTTPKLEMFARAPRAGWDCWGNEIANED